MSHPDEYGIAMRGWAKFLEFDGMGELNLKFYLNPEWKEQQKKPFDEEAEDEFGAIEIPGPDMFYFVVGPKGLMALTSRRNNIAKVTKVMPINIMKPIVKTKKGLTGGVEDLGNFREGFCWKVVMDDDREWIMCTPSITLKEDWMDAITKVKGMASIMTSELKSLEGEVSLDETDWTKTPPAYDQTGPDGEKIEVLAGSDPRPTQSEWRNLQDWSTCTLECGGGTQTLHRECILGSAPDAQPCSGEPIITKPCNETPCQPPPGEEGEKETLPMKVRMQRVSYRPQRFETCLIKEGDLEMVRDDIGNFERPIRVPTRVVLNNMTVTVFQTTKFDSILFSVALADTALTKFGDDTACFRLVNQADGKSVALCSLPTIMGDSMENNRNEWVKQIGFFRDNCHKQLQVQPPDMDIANIKAGEVEMEQEEAQQRAQGSGGSSDTGKKMEQVSQMAVDALSKETKYEKLAEQEELDREVLQELNTRKAMEQLKAADECMARDQRKAAEMQRSSLQQESAAGQVDEMKGNIKNMVMNQRATASKKIAMMKKLADKK